jgi:hypothetical protein
LQVEEAGTSEGELVTSEAFEGGWDGWRRVTTAGAFEESVMEEAAAVAMFPGEVEVRGASESMAQVLPSAGEPALAALGLGLLGLAGAGFACGSTAENPRP